MNDKDKEDFENQVMGYSGYDEYNEEYDELLDNKDQNESLNID